MNKMNQPGAPDFMEFSKKLKKNKSEAKEALAEKAGVPAEQITDDTLKGVNSGLRGAKVASDAGMDPTKMTPTALKAMDPAKPATADAEKDDNDISNENKVMMALAASLPTLIGYAFGGYSGGAAGAQAGGNAVTSIGESLQKDNDKKAAQKEKEKDKAFASAEKEKDRAFDQEKFNYTKGKDAEEMSLKRKELAQKTEIAKLEKELKSKEAKVKTAGDLRNEYTKNPLTKNTQEVAQAYTKVQKASESQSAAGDMSLIYGFMKMQDPGSTVREGEYASAENARGVPASVIAAYNKALDGQRLSPAQRQDFLGQAENIYVGQMERQQELKNAYGQLADKYGAPRDEVIITMGEGSVGDIEQQRKQAAEDAVSGRILNNDGKNASKQDILEEIKRRQQASQQPQKK